MPTSGNDFREKVSHHNNIVNGLVCGCTIAGIFLGFPIWLKSAIFCIAVCILWNSRKKGKSIIETFRSTAGSSIKSNTLFYIIVLTIAIIFNVYVYVFNNGDNPFSPKAPSVIISSEVMQICKPIVLPPSIDPKNGINQAEQKIAAEIANNWNDVSQYYNAYVPISNDGTPSNYISPYVTIFNEDKSHNPIELSSNTSVIIDKKNVPKNINVVVNACQYGIGGGGPNAVSYHFPMLQLNMSKENTYTLQTSTGDNNPITEGYMSQNLLYFDYFFECVDPGIYNTTIYIKYTLSGSNHLVPVNSSFSSVICPEEITIWDAQYDTKMSKLSNNYKKYILHNGEYIDVAKYPDLSALINQFVQFRPIGTTAAAHYPASPSVYFPDWNNFTYETSCFSDHPRYFTAKGGKSIVDGTLFEIGIPIYGDITGDGKPEALVPYTCTGATSGPYNLFVYTVKNNSLIYLRQLPPEDRSYAGTIYATKNVKIYKGTAELSGIGYSNNAAHCCPDLNVTTKYQWNGNSFLPTFTETRTVQ